MPPLRVAFVTSELTPFVKTGGLADVSAALPAHLVARGHDVRVFMPLYRSRLTIDRELTRPITNAQDVVIRMGRREIAFDAVATTLPGTKVEVILLDSPELYGHGGVYGGGDNEHIRFAFLSRATLETCQRLGWGPDVFHVNDWPSALLPLYLRTLYAWDSLLATARTVLTIHNLGYQGLFGDDVLDDLGLTQDSHLFDQDDLRDGHIGFLKTGLLYASALTTVSPTYAQEIQTEAYGVGLHELLRRRRDSLFGILNGVDYDTWQPETDPHLTCNYSRDTLAHKAKNTAALLAELGLPPADGRPVLGLVSRLTAQKGLQLLFEALPPLLASNSLMFVALGSGEPRYAEGLSALQAAFPQQVCFYDGFSNPLAHMIEAGADMFVMPSRYEPCGLNQMYSLRYGTVPIVRRTGGLADSVEHFRVATGRGTGFLFDHFTGPGLRWALRQAVTVFQDRRVWQQLMRNGMAEDFSWQRPGDRYIELYRRLTAG